jgi:hypothetical protein
MYIRMVLTFNTTGNVRITEHGCAFVQQLLQRKSIIITQIVCVFVALGIQHAMCLRHIVICALPRSTILSHKRYDIRTKTPY